MGTAREERAAEAGWQGHQTLRNHSVANGSEIIYFCQPGAEVGDQATLLVRPIQWDADVEIQTLLTDSMQVFARVRSQNRSRSPRRQASKASQSPRVSATRP